MPLLGGFHLTWTMFLSGHTVFSFVLIAAYSFAKPKVVSNFTRFLCSKRLEFLFFKFAKGSKEKKCPNPYGRAFFLLGQFPTLHPGCGFQGTSIDAILQTSAQVDFSPKIGRNITFEENMCDVFLIVTTYLAKWGGRHT